MIFISESRIDEIKNKVNTDDEMKYQLEKYAEKAMKQEPLSVTFYKSPAESGNVHDYFSEGPYWWPNPEDPTGPYIKRDGEINPDRFAHHADDLNLLANTLAILAQAGLYLGRKDCFEKAAKLIKVWFLDEETKMNPHLEYGQAIRGICSGRGIGIIETAEFIKVIYAADILDRDGRYKDVISGLKAWLGEYLEWLNTSEKGLDEKNFYNNHSNWWNTLAASISAFVGDDEMLYECYEKYKNDILVNQVDNEGRFTDEISRTRSYHYTIFNMTACALMCEIAYHRGDDLWNYETADGKSLKKCVEFFKPYYENPFLWTYQEIRADGCYFESIAMKLAAMRLDGEIEKINIKRRKNITPCSVLCRLGILDLI